MPARVFNSLCRFDDTQLLREIIAAWCNGCFLAPAPSQLTAMKPALLFHALTAISCTSSAFAAPLTGAKINHAVNDVRIVEKGRSPHAAGPREIMSDEAALLTGPQSRAELIFPDGTLVRIGADTSLHSLPRSRELVLEKGTLLVQTPAFHGGARIHTGAFTSKIGSASILLEHLPEKSVKITVLEGDAGISLPGFLAERRDLVPGRLFIAVPNARLLPDLVDVDLATLVKSSSLIDPVAFRGASNAVVDPLPSISKIERAIERQAAQLKARTLVPTNLVIRGSGTSVVIPEKNAPRVATMQTSAQRGRTAAHERASDSAADTEAALPEL